MRRRTRLEGAIEVATEALHGGLATVQGVERAISRKPYAALRRAPAVSDVSETVHAVHAGVADLVYSSIRTGVNVLAGVAKVAVALGSGEDREPRVGSAGDLAIAALNGIAGDRLEQNGNPLAVTMDLRHHGKRLTPDRETLATAFPHATPRLAIFVHGLAGNESCWTFYAQRHYGDDHTSYGSRLQADLGYTPLYLRYNTGLHISENGRRLAPLIDRIVAAWPVAVEEIVLVGHSMGGLVMRSACHQARELALDWVSQVRHVFFLGSPHLGAPLEKAGNVAGWILGSFEVTRALAEAINGRSAGIKDLRFGALLDEHWDGSDIDALLVDRTDDVPLLEGAAHYFVAATITRDAGHPLGFVIGDWLVREASATGRGRVRPTQSPSTSGRQFGPMSHMELLNHPDVYAQMRGWLEKHEATLRS